LQGNARHRKAPQLKATRIGAWRQALFRAALAHEQFNALHRISVQRKALHSTAFQSNADCPLATAGFPGRFGPKAQQRIANQRMALHRIAIQSNADRSLATGSFPGRFGPNAAQRTAVCGRALHCMARQFKATRFAHSLSVLTGLFCPPGRVSSAALSTD
jgi:hypothetical protein